MVPPAPKPTPEPTRVDPRLEVYQTIASVIAASAAVLATRFLLLLSLVGAFVLALIAMQSSSWLTLGVLCAYAILIVIPMVYLETRTKWSG